MTISLTLTTIKANGVSNVELNLGT